MLLPGLLENEKSWKKRVSECNSVAVKPMKILQNFRITPPFPFLEVQSFHPHPTYLAMLLISVYMRVDYCGTYNGSKSQWHSISFLF